MKKMGDTVSDSPYPERRALHETPKRWLEIKGEANENGMAVWWIYATDGTEYLAVEGPFNSEAKATARLAEIEEEPPD